MTHTRIHQPGATDYALLIGLAAVFGASFLFTSISVREIPPLTVVASRLFMALLILYPIMRLSGQALPPIGPVWWPIAASAFFGNALPFSLVSWGQVRVEAGLTSIFMAFMPLATVVLAHIFTHDEKINGWKMVGVLCGLCGVIVLFGADALGAVGNDTVRQLAILGAAFCYAVNAIITRQLVRVPRQSMVAALILASSAMMVPASLLLEQPWTLTPSAAALGALLALAIGPTALATLMILIIIDRQGASFLSQINFMVPIFGVAFASAFLGERLAANAWIALILILIGIGLSRRGASGKGRSAAHLSR